MTHLVYPDNEPPRGPPKVPIHLWDGTRQYLRHYSNLLYLSFILQRSDDRTERARAARELRTCERKLEYWRRHPRYSHEDAVAGIAELKRQWRER